MVFGATVQLIEVETDEEVTYQIVGIDEADVKEGRISILSPLARALIGKKAGINRFLFQNIPLSPRMSAYTPTHKV